MGNPIVVILAGLGTFYLFVVLSGYVTLWITEGPLNGLYTPLFGFWIRRSMAQNIREDSTAAWRLTVISMMQNIESGYGDPATNLKTLETWLKDYEAYTASNFALYRGARRSLSRCLARERLGPENRKAAVDLLQTVETWIKEAPAELHDTRSDEHMAFRELAHRWSFAFAVWATVFVWGALLWPRLDSFEWWLIPVAMVLIAVALCRPLLPLFRRGAQPGWVALAALAFVCVPVLFYAEQQHTETVTVTTNPADFGAAGPTLSITYPRWLTAADIADCKNHVVLSSTYPAVPTARIAFEYDRDALWVKDENCHFRSNVAQLRDAGVELFFAPRDQRQLWRNSVTITPTIQLANQPRQFVPLTNAVLSIRLEHPMWSWIRQFGLQFFGGNIILTLLAIVGKVALDRLGSAR